MSRPDPTHDAHHADDPYAPLLGGDFATEVTALFDDRLADGLCVADASAAVVDAYRPLLNDEERGPILILALAIRQVRHDGLQAAVRDAATELLEDPATLLRANPSADPAARATVRRLLERLSDDLAAVDVR